MTAWPLRDEQRAGVPANAYAVVIAAKADRSLTDNQMNMLAISRTGSVAHESTTRYLRWELHLDAVSVGDAVTEAFRLAGKAAREAGFSFEAEELRVLPFARLEEETMRLLSAGLPRRVAAGCEAVVDKQDEGGMEEMIAYLVGDMGYSRNECPDRCPYKADEHAHLHSPGNPASIGIPARDFIYWEDGTSSHSDPTREPDCISKVDNL